VSANYWNLGSSDFRQDWSDKTIISANNDWSGVPSIVGFLGDYTSGSPSNVDPQTLTGMNSTTVNVFANQTNPTTFNSGGVAEFDIANPTIAIQGSGTADAPYLVLHLDARGRQNVTLSFNARDLDGSADNAVQQLAVQYRLSDTGPWTNVYYNPDVTEGGTATKVTEVKDVTLPADANDAAQLQVRIMTTNAGGNDEWVGIDDIVVTSTGSGGDLTGTLGIADASVVEGNDGVQGLTFTVSRTGGSDGAVEATYTVGLPGGANGADAGDFAPGAAFTGKVSFASGQTSATIRLPVLGDRLAENNEAFTVTLSAPTGGAQIGRAVATGTILNDDVNTLLVGQIQGEGHSSAYVGQSVVTNGIVTAVDSNGFYIQDGGDANARTSDGIFVFTSTAPEVFVGDSVVVAGRVSEFVGGTGGLSVTQIVSPTVDIASYGNFLPAATLIGTGGLLPPTQVIDNDGLTSYDPTTDGIDFWESLEGMLVTIDNPLVVSNTNSFGETDVVASLGVGATGVNDRGGITVSPGDFNPEKIQIDDDSAIFAGFKPGYNVGDQLSSVSGIVNYAFNQYEVLVTDAVTVTKDVTLVRETTTLVGDADHLSIATYNVENLDASDNKFDILASNIVYNLRAPDVIALQEIQDADGAGRGTDLSGVPTANGLIAAIAKLGYGNYKYVEIAPTVANTTGGEPNGNIRNGYLYNDDRVDYVAGSATLITGGAYSNSRNPLAAQFEFNGEKVTAINVHFTSRGGSDPLWGATQPPADAGDVSRTNQAAGVKAWVQDQLANDPGLNVAILGDFNGFYFENFQTQLTDPARGGVFTNLNTLLAPEERYSYLFEGNAQQLDNILVTGGLLDGARYDAVHINSQFTGDRPTDHDPQLALLKLGNGGAVANEDLFAFAGHDQVQAGAGEAGVAPSFDAAFHDGRDVVIGGFGDWVFREHLAELQLV
jgi:predicted extracellular nuclease